MYMYMHVPLKFCRSTQRLAATITSSLGDSGTAMTLRNSSMPRSVSNQRQLNWEEATSTCNKHTCTRTNTAPGKHDPSSATTNILGKKQLMTEFYQAADCSSVDRPSCHRPEPCRRPHEDSLNLSWTGCDHRSSLPLRVSPKRQIPPIINFDVNKLLCGHFIQSECYASRHYSKGTFTLHLSPYMEFCPNKTCHV